MTIIAAAAPVLPELPLERWEKTKETLHLWTQIVGKVADGVNRRSRL